MAGDEVVAYLVDLAEGIHPPGNFDRTASGIVAAAADSLALGNMAVVVAGGGMAGMAGIQARNRIQLVAPLVAEVEVEMMLVLCLETTADSLASSCSTFPGGLQHEAGSPST